MFALSESTGFRKSEVALPNGEDFDDRCLRRALLLWKFDEAPHADPSSEPLRTLLADRDKAVIKPFCSIRTRTVPSGARTPSGPSSTPQM